MLKTNNLCDLTIEKRQDMWYNNGKCDLLFENFYMIISVTLKLIRIGERRELRNNYEF